MGEIKKINLFLIIILSGLPILSQNRTEIKILWKSKVLMANSRIVNKKLRIDTTNIFNQIYSVKYNFPENIDSSNSNVLEQYKIVKVCIKFCYKNYYFQDSIFLIRNGRLDIEILKAPRIITSSCRKARQVSIYNHLPYGTVSTYCINKQRKRCKKI